LSNTIGILNEKPLHAALKKWYTRPGDKLEAPVGGFTVDILRGDLLIEIQTQNLSRLRSKLVQLLAQHMVRVVYPITLERWIVRKSRNGRRVLGRRKSPKRGGMESVFEELVSIARLMAHPNFSLHVVGIHEEQIRHLDTGRSWRRKGWVIQERRLLQVVDQWLFETPRDMMKILPTGLPEFFTTTDLSEMTGQPLWLAQKMAYCLRKMGTITATGKLSRSILYVRSYKKRAE
jgi:hypothetical protein